MSKEQVTENNNEENFVDDFDQAFGAFSDGIEPEVNTPDGGSQVQENTDASSETVTLAKGGENTEDNAQAADLSNDRENDVGYWKQRYNSDVGRVNAYQRQIQEKEQEVAELKQQLNEHTSGKPPQETPAAAESEGMPEDLEELKEDFPELYNAYMNMSAKYEQKLKEQEDKFNALSQQIQPLTQAQTEQQQEQHLAAIKAAHSDVATIVEAPEFNAWLNSQPPLVQSIAEQGSAQDVIWMLNQYKASQSQARADSIQQQRQQRVKSAATIKGRQSAADYDLGLTDFESAFNEFSSG